MQLDHAIENKMKKWEGYAFNAMAIAHYYKGDRIRALDYFHQFYEVAVELKDTNSIGAYYGNVASIYDDLEQYDKQLYYYKKGVVIAENNRDTVGASIAYHNIGLSFKSLEKLDSALFYLKKALEIKRKKNYDEIDPASTYDAMGDLYFQFGNYNLAKSYYDSSHHVNKILNNKRGFCQDYLNYGAYYNHLGEFDKAKKYCNKALKIAVTNQTEYCYKCLKEAYIGLGDHKRSLEYFTLYIQLKDSLDSKEKIKLLAYGDAKYEYGLEKQADSLRHFNEQFLSDLEHQKELQTKQIYIYVGLSSFCVLFFITFLIYKSFLEKRKSNTILTDKNNTINEQNEELNQQNEEILTQREAVSIQKQELEIKNELLTSSINYAKRIQLAILPEDQTIQNYLPNSFILYKPKDIVSGDFYWIDKVGDNILFSAVDCTGHGVPGAFMSIVGNNGLNKAVKEYDIITPSKVLDSLNEHVSETLKQDTSEIKDGMDLSFYSLNTKTNELEFSGANNPLYIISKGELEEIKADRQAIGDKGKSFTNHKIQLKNGDCIYSFTDGYADQFGGEKGKKFMYGKFKNLLIEISPKPMSKQKQILISTFENWKGDLEQVDDICIIGVRI